MKKLSLLVCAGLSLVSFGTHAQDAKEMSNDPSAKISTPGNPTGNLDNAALPTGAIIEMKVPKTAKVFFTNLKDGQKVKKDTDILVKFGVKGMKIKPAGDMATGTGHHHLVIDGLPIDKGMVVPADEKHIHFGAGQTETKIKLPAGKHTLVLQFANGAHLSYGPSLSQTIEVSAE